MIWRFTASAQSLENLVLTSLLNFRCVHVVSINRYVPRFKKNSASVVLSLFRMNNLVSNMQAYMLKYDSTHGPFKGTINVLSETALEINGKQIAITCNRSVSQSVNRTTFCAHYSTHNNRRETGAILSGNSVPLWLSAVTVSCLLSSIAPIAPGTDWRLLNWFSQGTSGDSMGRLWGGVRHWIFWRFHDTVQSICAPQGKVVLQKWKVLFFLLQVLITQVKPHWSTLRAARRRWWSPPPPPMLRCSWWESTRGATTRAWTWSPTRAAPPTAWRPSPRHVLPSSLLSEHWLFPGSMTSTPVDSSPPARPSLYHSRAGGPWGVWDRWRPHDDRPRDDGFSSSCFFFFFLLSLTMQVSIAS